MILVDIWDMLWKKKKNMSVIVHSVCIYILCSIDEPLYYRLSEVLLAIK